MLKNKINIIKLMLIAAFAFVISISFNCDMVDPTEVTNPSITEDALLANPVGGTAPLVTGLRTRFADAVRMTVIATEVVSDNYDNTQTFISPDLDFPRIISPDDQHINSTTFIYFRIQNLRALADFGLEVIVPKDIMANNDQKAEVYFYHGVAYLLLAENFWAFPIKEDGGPVTSADAIKIAIADFKTAQTLASGSDIKVNCKYALARAYRLNGDKANAEIEAKAALSLSSNFLFNAEYDPVNLTTYLNAFLFTRAQYDLQPLPRLDFLDPKYTTDGTPIPFLKAEEANLILAEVAIANSDIATAKTYMKAAITTAKARTTSAFSDRDARRNRPNDVTYSIKASASATPVNGLIQRRAAAGAPVTLSPVSNTSLTAGDIDAITTQNQAVRILYLLRQEIFFTEGRRMSDLGIRLPIMRRQMDVNVNFPAGAPGTSVVVPSYIPQGDEMDKFTIDAAAKMVTIMHDVNQIIADNYNTMKPFK